MALFLKSIEDRRKIINKSLSYFLISFLKTAFYKKKSRSLFMTERTASPLQIIYFSAFILWKMGKQVQN